MQHFTGSILSDIALAVTGSEIARGIQIFQHQSNSTHGIHQAAVKLEGHPTIYRLILAPVDAPLGLPHGGERHMPIDRHFTQPLV